MINGAAGPTGEIAAPEASLMAVASAGEHMLMQALAQYVSRDGVSVRVNELVPMAHRNSTQDRQQLRVTAR